MRGGLDSLDAVRTIATIAGSQRPKRARRVARFVRPPFLREGDSVGLVAISSKTDSARMKHYLAAVDTVRSWGLRVRLAAHLFDRSGGWFASADSVRAQELQQMLENPHLRAVLFFAAATVRCVSSIGSTSGQCSAIRSGWSASAT